MENTIKPICLRYYVLYNITMNVTILNIGDELLIGQVVNTNASVMSQLLTSAGFRVVSVLTIGDNREDITAAVSDSLASCDITLLTGGLGPTKDDITKTVLCDLFQSELYENAEALANIERIFARRNYPLTPINRQQAWVPRACTMINNSLGTAPAMWFERDGHVLVSLPGVPFEMEHLMVHEIVPRLQRHFHSGAIVTKNILVQGIGESFLSDLIEPWELQLPQHISLAYLPQAGVVKLRLTSVGDNQETLRQEITTQLQGLYALAGKYIVGEDYESLPELAAATLADKNITLATAESCTGGTIASRLTAIAGASQWFKGGVVSYCNEVKHSALGVKDETLESYGAVSEPTAREMAEGVRSRLASDYAIATTGVAGPTGGTDENPVGTVWIAVASPSSTVAFCSHYGSRRQQNIDRAVNEALASLIRIVNNKPLPR